MLTARKDSMRHWASTGHGLREYVGGLVVVAQHMVKLEHVELVFQIAHRLAVRHLWVHIVFILHDLVHNQLRVPLISRRLIPSSTGI
jgi:hypothetical protein